MQEVANSDASESTLISSRGQECFSSEHPTPKLQQRADRISNLSEGLRSRLDHFMLPQDEKHTGSSKVEATGLAQGVLRWLACPACSSYTTQCPANRTDRQLWHSFASDGPIQTMWSSESLWWQQSKERATHNS